MTAAEAIREILNRTGVGVTALAGRLNINQNTMSMRLSQKSMTVAKLHETLRVLDYKVVVVPREARIPDGGFEVE